jgi:hypothetical protein
MAQFGLFVAVPYSRVKKVVTLSLSPRKTGLLLDGMEEATRFTLSKWV